MIKSSRYRLLVNGESEPRSIVLRRGHASLISQYLRWQMFRKSDWVTPARGISDSNYSGRKIRAQKKSGGTPIGSRASSMLRGGGVMHGPVSRLRRISMNKKSRRLAIETLLSYFAEKSRLILLPQMPRSDKTSEYIKMYGKTGMSGKIIYIVPSTEEYWLGLRNVPGHDCLWYGAINCSSMVDRDYVCLDLGILDKIDDERYALKD